MDRLFKLNAPAVVSEIIDGEAVIMHLKSGNYYSTEHVGGQIWSLLGRGLSSGQILDLLAARYPVARAELAASLDAFIAELLAQDLVREIVAPPATFNPADTIQLNNATRPFATPVLNVFADMKDLLLLDPIHDVDEIGWPTPKPDVP